MLDFKELPVDGIKFEQLVRELLVLEGFNIQWTGVGPDNGRDLILTEQLTGLLSQYERKWLISCKHNANSGKSVGREAVPNISDDCKAIGAQGFILVCSTQPTASLLTRLEEIEINQGIVTKIWDSIELEKRLSKPNTFRLIHTFFPNSSKNYKWNIYNTFSPTFWAANYKDNFLYMSSRLSHSYPYLESIETIVSILHKIPIFKDKKYGWDSHYLRLRAVYFDDKYSKHTAYVDYIYPEKSKVKYIIQPQKLYRLLQKAFTSKEHNIMNPPTWDVLYKPEFTLSDSFDIDHKRYYEPYLSKFQRGDEREEFLHEIVYSYEMMQRRIDKENDT